MDASIPLAAAIEHNTYALLTDKLLLGDDDSFGSPIERIFIATNSAEWYDNPQRQGLSADLADGHRPNNTLGGIPTLALDYSLFCSIPTLLALPACPCTYTVLDILVLKYYCR